MYTTGVMYFVRLFDGSLINSVGGRSRYGRFSPHHALRSSAHTWRQWFLYAYREGSPAIERRRDLLRFIDPRFLLTHRRIPPRPFLVQLGRLPPLPAQPPPLCARLVFLLSQRNTFSELCAAYRCTAPSAASSALLRERRRWALLSPENPLHTQPAAATADVLFRARDSHLLLPRTSSSFSFYTRITLCVRVLTGE